MGFMPFGRQVGLAGQPSPALAQPAGAITQPLGAEPSLERALAALNADEVRDYQTWTAKEKFLFLAGYQWTAIATAKGLHRVDGTPFDGFLPQGMATAFEALAAMSSYFKDSPELAAGADQATSILQEAANKTEPQGQAVAKKYRLLRDRVAWELATAGATVEYEVVGDDPANPGVLYTRKIGEDKAPDLSAVFSGYSPREMWDAGLKIQDKYEAGGVTFKRLDLSSANPRLGAGAPPVLAIIIAAIVAILAFFWLYNHTQDTKKINSTAIELIQKDTTLTDAEKADRILKIKSSSSFFDTIFGNQFPWTTVIIGATVVGIAYFLLPSLLVAYTAKPSHQARGATA